MKYDFCGFSNSICDNKEEDVEILNAEMAIDYAKRLLQKWEDETVEVSRRIQPHGDWPIAAVFRDGEIILP